MLTDKNEAKKGSESVGSRKLQFCMEWSEKFKCEISHLNRTPRESAMWTSENSTVVKRKSKPKC